MATTFTETPPTPNPDEGAVMSWLDHFRELRNRLVKACIAVFAGMLIGFWAFTWNDFALLRIVIDRFARQGLIVIHPAESFTNVIQLALGAGIALAMPVIVYQLMAFIVPGLTSRERRIIFLMLPFVTVCFLSGLVFGWFITLPAAFRFLLTFGPPEVKQTPTLDLFLSTFTHLMLLNGLLFELPVIVYVVIWLGAIQRKTLTRYRRYTILIIVIIAAVITPTGDPVNLALVAVPMYLLYELGLLLALIAPRRKTADSTP